MEAVRLSGKKNTKPLFSNEIHFLFLLKACNHLSVEVTEWCVRNQVLDESK